MIKPKSGGMFTDLELKSMIDKAKLGEQGGLRGTVNIDDGIVKIRWYYQYRSPVTKTTREISCGIYPDLSMSNIRKARDKFRLKISEKIDPQDERLLTRDLAIEQRQVEIEQKRLDKIEYKKKVDEALRLEAESKANNLTVRNLFDQWVQYGVRRKDGNAEIHRVFCKDVLPSIGNKPLKMVKETDIRCLLEDIVTRGANRITVQVHNLLIQMFSWAEKRQPWRGLLIDGNPVVLVDVSKIVPADYDMNNVRSRVLSEDEIIELKTIFIAMDAGYLNAENKRTAVRPVQRRLQIAVWICLSTLCRISPLLKARWEHIDFEGKTWFIPAQNDKGGGKTNKDEIIYLSSFALVWFGELFKISGHSEWCYPAVNTDGHVCEKSMSKQIGDRQEQFTQRKTKLKGRRQDNSLVLSSGKSGKWTLHDLRRTGATMMQGLGVENMIIELCQSHAVLSKTGRHYLHASFVQEKKDAWEKLSDKLVSLLEIT